MSITPELESIALESLFTVAYLACVEHIFLGRTLEK